MISRKPGPRQISVLRRRLAARSQRQEQLPDREELVKGVFFPRVAAVVRVEAIVESGLSCYTKRISHRIEFPLVICYRIIYTTPHDAHPHQISPISAAPCRVCPRARAYPSWPAARMARSGARARTTLSGSVRFSAMRASIADSFQCQSVRDFSS